MTRSLLPLALGLSLAPQALAQQAYVHSNVGDPWGNTENQAAMDLAFGAGAWDHLYVESVNVGTLFSPSYTTIWLEGSDDNATELENFLLTNQAAMEAWVSSGGQLFLNAAPNEGGNQNWGFGGVTLVYVGGSAADPGTAVDPNHSIFLGPNPTVTSFTGSAYAHAYITGPGLTPLLADANGNANISELQFGAGTVVFGGLTTTNFWTPTVEAVNLRANILDYLGYGAVTGDPDADGIDAAYDNCPTIYNPGQGDIDIDGLGDDCDDCDFDPDNDIDNDGICGDVDVCPTVADPDQYNADYDANGDACDICPFDADDDIDQDGVCGDVDNCPDFANPGQVDNNGDGVGDACEGTTTPTGTATGTATGTGTGTATGTATGGTGTGTATGAATGTGTGTPAPTATDLGGGCGCSSSGGTAPVWTLLPLVALLARRRD